MTTTLGPIALGRLVMTAAVAELMVGRPALAAHIAGWLAPHALGECPHMTDDDQALNALAVQFGSRVLTSWPTGDDDEPVIWIVTEWDRSATTVLLPSDY